MSYRSVVLVLVVAGAAVSCENLPGSATKPMPTFEKRARGNELGWAYYERFKRQNFQLSGIVLPEFAYNPERDTCFAVVGANVANPDGGNPILHRKIVDVLSNVTVAEFRNAIAQPAFRDDFQLLMGFEYSNAPLDPELFLAR